MPDVVMWPLPISSLSVSQPRPCMCNASDAGFLPKLSAGLAPCALPKAWPPAVSATVSSEFIAMREKVARMSRADCSGSGLPPGPSGLT